MDGGDSPDSPHHPGGRDIDRAHLSEATSKQGMGGDAVAADGQHDQALGLV